jgi:hypothetical protein
MHKTYLAGATAVLIATSNLRGGITASQGLGSNWIGTPAILTASSPAQFTLPEANYGDSAPYSLSQSFLVTGSGTLDNIQLYVSGSFASNTIHIYDLGTGATPGSYTPGSGSTSADLLIHHQFQYFGGTDASVLKLQFSGADAISLAAGHRYVFEIDPMVGPYIGPMTWYRSSADLYADGAAYRQQSGLNASLGLDMSLAVNVIPVPEPSSFLLAGLGFLLGERALSRKPARFS